MAAVRKVQVQYDLKPNKVSNSTAFGKYYAQLVRNSTINLDGLAAHISDHGSIYTPDIVVGVLTKFRSCLVELLSQGTAVKIDGLGTFYPSFESEGAETYEKYSISSQLKGVHIRFRPDDSDATKLTSKAFLAKCICTERIVWDENDRPVRINGKPVGEGNDDDDPDDGD